MKQLLTSITIAFIVMTTALLSSCSKSDIELSKSVFIEDYNFPGLPEYSEWGYNTFGMYIDKGKFISSDDVFPVKIIVNPDTCNITFSGKYNQTLATLRISIIGYAPTNYPELIELNDSILNLKASNCILTLNHNDKITPLRIIEGRIMFKRAQNLYVDNEFARTILSGIIEFKTFLNNEPVAITNGRFDLGIGYDNFYYY